MRQRHATDPTGEHHRLTNPGTGTETGEGAHELLTSSFPFSVFFLSLNSDQAQPKNLTSKVSAQWLPLSMVELHWG